MPHCPARGELVRFRPRLGLLPYYVAGAKHHKHPPLADGDVGIVVGQGVPDFPGDRKRVVVRVERTQSVHEIDCQDVRRETYRARKGKRRR